MNKVKKKGETIFCSFCFPITRSHNVSQFLEEIKCNVKINWKKSIFRCSHGSLECNSSFIDVVFTDFYGSQSALEFGAVKQEIRYVRFKRDNYFVQHLLKTIFVSLGGSRKGITR